MLLNFERFATMRYIKGQFTFTFTFKSRLSDHLTSNNLVTALLYIRHIYAVGSRKISCLLDLSAAFDTID